MREVSAARRFVFRKRLRPGREGSTVIPAPCLVRYLPLTSTSHWTSRCSSTRSRWVQFQVCASEVRGQHTLSRPSQSFRAIYILLGDHMRSWNQMSCTCGCGRLENGSGQIVWLDPMHSHNLFSELLNAVFTLIYMCLLWISLQLCMAEVFFFLVFFFLSFICCLAQ